MKLTDIIEVHGVSKTLAEAEAAGEIRVEKNLIGDTVGYKVISSAERKLPEVEHLGDGTLRRNF